MVWATDTNMGAWWKLVGSGPGAGVPCAAPSRSPLVPSVPGIKWLVGPGSPLVVGPGSHEQGWQLRSRGGALPIFPPRPAPLLLLTLGSAPRSALLILPLPFFSSESLAFESGRPELTSLWCSVSSSVEWEPAGPLSGVAGRFVLARSPAHGCPAHGGAVAPGHMLALPDVRSVREESQGVLPRF